MHETHLQADFLPVYEVSPRENLFRWHWYGLWSLPALKTRLQQFGKANCVGRDPLGLTGLCIQKSPVLGPVLNKYSLGSLHIMSKDVIEDYGAWMTPAPHLWSH